MCSFRTRLGSSLSRLVSFSMLLAVVSASPAVDAQSSTGVMSSTTVLVSPGQHVEPLTKRRIFFDGRKVLGAERKIFEQVMSVRFLEEVEHVNAYFKGAGVGLQIDERAKPGAHTLAVIYRVQYERVVQRGRRLVWQEHRLVEENHQLVVVVDMEEVPSFYLAEEAKTLFAFPDGVVIVGAKLAKSGVGEVHCRGSRIFLEAKRKGSTNLEIHYSIGGQRLEREVLFKVSDYRMRIERALPEDGTTEITADEIEKMTRLDEVRWLALDGVTDKNAIARGALPAKSELGKASKPIRLERAREGEGVVHLTVRGLKGAKKSRVVMTLAIDIVPAE